MSTNGLDMMKAAREKKGGRRVGNEMPPPLHRPRSTPVTLPPASADAEGSPAETPAPAEPAAVLPTVAPSVPAGSTRPATTAKKQEKRADRATNSELIPTTAYLELEEDRYIRRTIEAGRYGKPKVTSASAVIRYAVQYLAEHMTPDEVVAAIREAAPETSNQGRIRL